MEQQNDRRIGGTCFTVEDGDPASFNAMVRRQRNTWSVCHAFPRSLGFLDEIEGSTPTTERADARKGGYQKTTSINAQLPPCLCCLLQPFRRLLRSRPVRTAARPTAASVDFARQAFPLSEESPHDVRGTFPSTAASV